MCSCGEHGGYSCASIVEMILKRIRGNGFDNIDGLTLLCCPTPNHLRLYNISENERCGGSEGETV